MDWCQTCRDCCGYLYRNSAGEQRSYRLCEVVPTGWTRIPDSRFNCWTGEHEEG